MPVTARLSKRFYDQLGDDLTNELVEWFNQVDAASRDDLRAMNEMNFARFDARLEQRVAKTDARIDRLGDRLDARIDALGAHLDGRIDAQSARIDAVEAGLTSRIDVVEAGLTSQLKAVDAGLTGRMDRIALEIRADLSTRFTEHTRWMILSYGVLLSAIVGLYAR